MSFKCFLITLYKLGTHHAILAGVADLVGEEQKIYGFDDEYRTAEPFKKMEIYIVRGGAVRVVHSNKNLSLYAFEQVDLPKHDAAQVAAWFAKHANWKAPVIVNGTGNIGDDGKSYIFAVDASEDEISSFRASHVHSLEKDKDAENLESIDDDDYIVLSGHRVFRLPPEEKDEAPVALTEAEAAELKYSRDAAEAFWAKAA